jgi:hypothetical protein
MMKNIWVLCWLLSHPHIIMMENNSLRDPSGQMWTFASTLTKSAIICLTVSVSPGKFSKSL